MKKIAVIPIDNRPICYTLFEQVSAINKDIELFLPERKLLGGLIEPADISGILNWLKSIPKPDYIIISLDTVAYGGLVSSRRCNDTFDAICARLAELKKLLNAHGAKVLAFSSVMRISNNSINEEEKEYWNPWGTDIFAYSYQSHKAEVNNLPDSPKTLVPQDILTDYIQTRQRNFNINKLYLNWLADGTLDTLVYSKDDTGEYGWNVKEAQTLSELAKSRNLNAIIKTGADEIPLTLFARALLDNENVKIKPVFVFDDSKGKISKYEDISLENCVKSQLSLAGVDFTTCENPDITMVINNFEVEQGDLVLGSLVNSLSKEITFPKTPYFIADVSNANGADSELVRQMMNEKLKNQDILGFSAYNTSANTIGSSVCMAVNAYLARKNAAFDPVAFKALFATRLLDDWAYQAHVRKPIMEGGAPFESGLYAHKQDFIPFQKQICDFLDVEFEAEFSLPWHRSFEIEININNLKNKA